MSRDPTRSDAAGRPRPPLRARVGPYLVLAALSYVPMLLSAPGRVGADTKHYLYLDPGRWLSRAPYMWDPNVGAGTVTHQNIGYLWPMGPFYWLFDAARVPDWVAQRIWLGSILFLAGAGVLFLLRTLGWPHDDERRSATMLVGALAYMLTPYSLEYAARISVIMLPWAALPWMVGLTVRGLRTGGWRHPALLALVATTAGSVNATALAYAAVGPALWLPFAVWGLRETTVRRAAAFVGRIALLTVAVSLWWIAGLATQAGYGLNVLAFTETLDVVARTSLPSEALRGLGNWFFYGRDKLGPWVEAAVDYTQRPWVIATSFAVPALALLGAVVTRWRHRTYFAGLVVVGVVIAVGVHPYDDPAPIGRAYKAFAEASTAGLALRSVGRAVPLVALGTAVLLAAGAEALRRRSARMGGVATAAIAVLVVANIPPLWQGNFFGGELDRPSDIPAYWRQAAAHLDRRGDQTRVLELPGSDFASYRWGNTIDPVTPGLMDRPYLARELIPFGSAASADLLNALDRRLQEGVLEGSALAPIARLLAAGDVVLRSDLQFERYRTPRPRPTWALLSSAPGLGAPVAFGPAEPSVPVVPMDDELELATPTGAPHPPAAAAFPVVGSPPIVRTRAAANPLVVAGDGEGLVEAAAAGLLPPDQVVLYSAPLTSRPGSLAGALDAGADLLVTDSNRRRARGWGIIRETTGYTEQAGEEPLVEDPRDARLPLFPDAGDGAFTVTELRGPVASVRATGYGNPVSFTAGDRPALAFDGDVRTAWTVGAFDEVVGERLVVDLRRPVAADEVTLVQPLFGPRDRFVTRAGIRLDGGAWTTVALGDESRTSTGQRVAFGGPRSFRRLEVRVDEINVGRRADYRGNSGVGFAEVRIGDAVLDEVVRLPTDLLDAAGESSLDHALTVLLSRARGNPAEDFRAEEEVRMARTFSLPTAREFSLTGTARLSAAAPDVVLDRALRDGGAPAAAGVAPGGDEGAVAPSGDGGDAGAAAQGEPAVGTRPGADLIAAARAAGIPVASSSARLPGFPAGRASAALDGDPATFWSSPRGAVVGQWLDVALPAPAVVDRLDLRLVADGRHSVPTRLRIDADGVGDGGGVTRQQAVVDLPPVADRAGENAVAAVPVAVPAMTVTRLRVTVEAVREVQTIEYFSEQPITQPVAIAELGLPGVAVPPLADGLPPTCRADLLTVDGRPFPLRVVGSTTSAVVREGLRLEPCADAAGSGPGTLALSTGAHVVRTAPGRATGIDVDRLVLSSAPGGGPAAGGPTAGAVGAASPSPDEVRDASAAGPPSPVATTPRLLAAPEGVPTVAVRGSTRVSYDLRLQGARRPFWLVLGQSHNDGWRARARVDGRSVDLGSPMLVDGYANGWLVEPDRLGPGAGASLEIELDWTPQRRVWAALAISAVAALACVVLAVAAPSGRRRRPRRTSGWGTEPEPHPRSPLAHGRGQAPAAPQLVLVDRAGRAPDRATVIAAAVVLGLGFLVVAGPGYGALAAVAVAVMCRARPATHFVAALGAPALVAAAGLYVAVQQVRYGFPALLEWPTHTERAGVLAWCGIALLAAHVVAARARVPPARRHD